MHRRLKANTICLKQQEIKLKRQTMKEPHLKKQKNNKK